MEWSCRARGHGVSCMNKEKEKNSGLIQEPRRNVPCCGIVRKDWGAARLNSTRREFLLLSFRRMI